jgi:formimidoylglutamase
MSGVCPEAGKLPDGGDRRQAQPIARHDPGESTVESSSQHPLDGLSGGADPRDPRAGTRRVDPPATPGSGLCLLGLPYDGGIPSRPGARFGPRAIREALGAFGAHDGRDDIPPLDDLGDLPLPTMNGREAHARIEEAARRVFSGGCLPVFLGGDHGCTGSVIRGLARARPDLRLALVSIDAHLDVREYEDDASLSSGTPFRRALETRVLSGERTAMIGLRAFANSRHYLDWARGQGIRTVGMEEIPASGPREITRDTISEITQGADALYLSIDLDAVDVAFAPGVSAPGIGGFSSREMIEIVGEIAGHPALVGADIMELSPPYDPDGRTARLAARLLLEIARSRARTRG